ncbi:MAG TPA: C13 family peptidase [bacterium]|nr:C13 family peptidase [bacterium]
MYRKALPFAAALAIILAAAAIAQEEVAPGDMFLKAERFKLRSDDAYKIVVTEVFKGDIGEREVYNSPGPVRAGTVIEDVMGHKFDAPKVDSWVYFVDDVPGADWGHPAKLVYADAMKGAPSVIDCHFPPKMLPAFGGITKGAAEEIGRIKDYEWWKEIKVPALEKYPFKEPSKNKKYHVLISGGVNAWMNNPRYLNDLKFIYYTLQKRFDGNGDDNVYVIYADGVSVDLDGDGDNDVDYAATEANVVGVLTTLAGKLGKDDILFVYVNNHGGYESGKDCYICLYYAEQITDDRFAALINKIQAGQMKFVFKQCYSGGMVDDLAALSGRNLVVATASKYDESAYGAESPPGFGADGYGEFTYWWTAAVYEGYPPTVFPGTHPTSPDPKTADVNNDNKVSMKEAFDFAKKYDRRPEHPQYYASPAAANEWTLCTKPCGCGEASAAEAAAFFGFFAACYGTILLRRKFKS